MVGRQDPSDTTADPDDWFAGSGVDPLDETRELSRGDMRSDGSREATWLDEADGASEPRPSAPVLAGLTARQLAVIVGAAIVVLLVVLAAAGVFSSNSSSNNPPPPPTTTPTTTPVQTTPPPASTPATTLPSGTLKPGATGADVKSLQQALANAGHSPGAIDGVYGPKTTAAVSAFQQSAGITVDGIYGPATKQALEKKTG
jgi:hypothetical protein